MKHIKFIAIFIMLFLGYLDSGAQDIIIDQPIRAGELTLFQSLSNKKEYYYLSDKPRMARDANGKPQFSFLRYVENKKSGIDQPNSEEGEGGGIVHAVIELDVTKEQLDLARQELQRLYPGGIIKGPAAYQGGTIALISSVKDPESGFSKKVLGLGKAPILEGQKAAISIQLTKLGAKVLWESFKTPTPDMSISFEMDLKGYKSPKRAIIEANFDQMYTSQSFQAAVVSRQGQTMMGAEIDAAFDDLVKSGSIKVIQIGEDEQLEKAIDDAYSKLTRLMFEPAGGNNPTLPIPGQTPTSPLERAQNLLQTGREQAIAEYNLMREALQYEETMPEITGTTAETGSEAPTRAHIHGRRDAPASYTTPPAHHRIPPRSASLAPPVLPTTAVVTSYRLRQSRQQGKYKIDLNKYSIDNLSIRFDENFGKINCADCFKEVNIGDDLYKQRELNTSLDGFNAEDFGKYINFVSVSIKKKHENGEFTTDELKIDRTQFNQQGNNFKLLYGWKNDNNRLKWREYEYKTIWNYFGGQSTESDWVKSNSIVIPLVPPFYRKIIDVELDIEKMNAQNVRSVEIKVYYKMGPVEQNKQARLNIKGGQATTQIDILQPFNQLQYEYELIWNLADGSTKTSQKKSSQSSIIYADNIQ